MLNGETWLAHSELFTKHWIIEIKPWARTLGWFTDFQATVQDANGWAQAGKKELPIFEYVHLIEKNDAEKFLYRYVNNTWDYITSPIVFVVRKNDDQVFIAGWAGDSKIINEYKLKTNNPWDWPDKFIIDVDPVAAIHTMKSPYNFPVFFVSNGETNSEENWEHLIKLHPKAIRIANVNGRRKMFQRCVDLSGNYSHFFVVTGKNKVTDKTIFDYPINSAPRAHVVFQAKNMSNRLEYGHMGVVAYNVDLVLSTPENFGLDFTTYSPVHTVPTIASEATFAATPYEAWRTAFRETVKLTLDPGSESHFWLDRWLSFAEGENSDWVLQGAKDGHEYAEQFRHSPDELRNTVDWNWLKEYFKNLHT
jgi:hypothetical protein